MKTKSNKPTKTVRTIARNFDDFFAPQVADAERYAAIEAARERDYQADREEELRGWE